MFTQTSKKIYENPKIAAMIAGKLAKHQNKKFEVFKVTEGYQVVAVQKLPAYMPPAKPAPVQKVDASQPKKLTVTGETAQFTFKLLSDAPKYLECWKADGSRISFGKTTVLDYFVHEEDGQQFVTFTMTKKQAKKRGIL